MTTALPPYKQRQFIPPDADLTDKDVVANLYRQLTTLPVELATALTAWLDARSELDAAVQQQRAVLYVRMTCQTDDEDRATAYQTFMADVMPVLKPLWDQLDRRYLQMRENIQLDRNRYEVYDRDTRADVALFRAENVPLETEVDLLKQRYQKECASLTVQFEGREYTMQQMRKFLLGSDRRRREAAWRATVARRLDNRDSFDDIFDALRDKRVQIAANADCADYREYVFRSMHRFDYTPDDCKRFHDAVARVVVPLQQQRLQRRAAAMGLDRLMPWDLDCDPHGREPLRPFDTAEQLIEGVRTMFERVDNDLARGFRDMIFKGLLDLDSRKGKAPGGYMATLDEARLPFIFMNAVGTNQDVRTLLHEGGHAFHTLLCMDDDIVHYRHAPLEFCEVASMSMELLAARELHVFYPPAQAARSQREHLERLVDLFTWIATVDAFQHWLYEHPDHDRLQRRHAWLEIRRRFDTGMVDWSGLQPEHESMWHRQLHIFQHPFYYIEYGIAQLGALQVWRNARTDEPHALSAYKAALKLGGSRPLPELFATADVRFDFGAELIAELMELIASTLAQMDD